MQDAVLFFSLSFRRVGLKATRCLCNILHKIGHIGPSRVQRPNGVVFRVMGSGTRRGSHGTSLRSQHWESMHHPEGMLWIRDPNCGSPGSERAGGAARACQRHLSAMSLWERRRGPSRFQKQGRGPGAPGTCYRVMCVTVASASQLIAGWSPFSSLAARWSRRLSRGDGQASCSAYLAPHLLNLASGPSP
jgi:hypothetical protein